MNKIISKKYSDKNNKGMAMVTVLIALTFIAIIASSLLYMAYMNYRMKVMRYNSMDNFYTAEYALADLTTTLQNIAANQPSVPDAVDKVKDAVGYSLASGVKSYSNTAVQALIQQASQEADILISTTDTYDTDGDGTADVSNFAEYNDHIMLYGVRITARTRDAEPYVSTISTDIKLVFDAAAGELDVNDFSVLTDSPIVLDNKEVIWSGNVFVGRGDGDTALTLKNVSLLTIISNRGIIAGDISIQRGCTVNITGNIVVYGDIKVEAGGSLICTGNLKHTGSIIRSTGGTVKGIPTTQFTPQTVPPTGIDTDGDGVVDDRLATAILSPVFVTTNGTDWIEMSLKDFSSGGTIVSAGRLKSSGTNPSNHTVITTTIGLENPINDGHDYLTLSASDVLEVRGDLPYSTIVSTGQITYFGDHKITYMQCMSDENYEFAKNIMVGRNGQLPNGANANFATGVAGYTIQLPAGLPAGYKEKVITDPDPTKGTLGRTVYYAHNQCYLPLGYFIAEDASLIISQAFAASSGDMDPKNTYVVYSNYVKE